MNKFLGSLVFSLSTVLGITLAQQPCLAGGAFQLSPAVVKFSPSGGGATQSFIITSTGDEPVAIQMDVVTRAMTLDGSEVNQDSSDDFIIYPPQIIVPPGTQQAVRVTWIGEPNPSKELAYRLVAEQLPVNLSQIVSVDEETGATVNITVTLRYLSSVYITPPNTSAKVVVESAAHEKSDNGQDSLVVVLDNQGTAHRLLDGVGLRVSSSNGESVTLEQEQLKGLLGENMLAETKRRFVLPWPKELPVGPVTATFTTN
ncbi:molecular chaperone [Synechocystis salina]|uniref:Molecular chaperone n=1 Tax=Synechocystis salina LEGE 00031 TaxID=1828736 RepID=A0ABR9VV08_9SYNC|nr:fimbria/pilus periplasmic chaperone [Synechocystis salina]MBE9241907.1 molecular chaperone [Synechocystis salina LEGE 00041]MBE9255177.1 molecular chaperone [Synechocystis salina LEGE 00031]